MVRWSRMSAPRNLAPRIIPCAPGTRARRRHLIAVYQQPGANALEISKEVRATLEELKKIFPPAWTRPGSLIPPF